MARSRILKPEFARNRGLYQVEQSSGLPCRVAYACLWGVTDRRGVFRWSENIQPDVLPYDHCEVLDVLEALRAAGFVVKYEVAGRAYGWIPRFDQHQSFHRNEQPSQYPGPPPSVVALHRPPTGAVPCEQGTGTTNTPPEPRTSTVLAPDKHEASTVVDPNTHGSRPAASVSVSVSASVSTSVVTATATAAAAAAVHTRRQLSVAANDAIDAVFGTTSRRRPLLPSSAVALVEALEHDHIPLDFACRAIADAVRTLKEPPRSLAYFAPIVRERWELDQLAVTPRRAADDPPRPSPSTGRIARNHAALARGLALLEGREVAARG